MREVTDSASRETHNCGDIAQKLQQEAYVLSAGTIGGATREFQKHPVKTIGDTLFMGVSAVGLTAVAAAELPVVSIVAAGTGAVYGASYAWNFIDPNSPHNIERNRSLKSAITNAWNTSDKQKLETSIMDLQSKVGPDALHSIQVLAVGGAAGKLSLKSIELVKSAANTQPMMFAAESALTSGLRFADESKAPTWNEYLNFNRRHGPITQKSIHQFELENVVKASTKRAETQPADEVKAQTPEHSQLSKESKNTNSQGRSDDDQEHGRSLYFSERFRRFHN